MKYEEPKFETVLLLQTYGVMTVVIGSTDDEVEDIEGGDF